MVYLKKYSFLLFELVKKGIKLKYRKSYLGILWSLIEPVLTTIVLTIIFGTLFNNKNPTYPLYIIIGRLYFNFFSEGTRNAMKAIRSNAAMIKKVYVPKYLYPLSSVIYSFIIFLISLIVLFGVQAFCKLPPSWQIWQFVPSLILLFLFTMAVGTILCVLNVFFRDIEYLWNVISMVLMYMSAIFYYPERLLDTQWAFLLTYNPLYQIITLGRNSIMGNPFELEGFLIALGITCVLLLIGNFFFYWKKNKFILHI